MIRVIIDTDSHLYRQTEGGAGVIGARQSWDLTAIYYAVLGSKHDGETIWELSAPGRASFTTDAKTRFVPEAGGPHCYLIRRMPDERLTPILEDLMTRSPRHFAPAARSEE